MTIKAQELADFIVEFTYDDTPNPKVNIVKDGEAEDNGGDATRWKLFVDGSSNQQGNGAGLILRTPLGE